MNPETSGITAKVGRGSNRITIAIEKDGTAEVVYRAPTGGQGHRAIGT
jgi:hypothetical protein